MSMEPKEKDFWDKAAIVLQPVGGLLAALAVAGLGFFGSQFIERRQSEETRARFVSELISKREEAGQRLAQGHVRIHHPVVSQGRLNVHR